MKKLLFELSLFTVVMFFSSCGKSHSKKESKLFEGDAIPVKLAFIKRTDHENSIEATGLLTTENEAKYSFKIGGVIDRITVNEGQFFKKGELLATLKVTEIEAQLAQASLGYEKSK